MLLIEIARAAGFGGPARTSSLKASAKEAGQGERVLSAAAAALADLESHAPRSIDDFARLQIDRVRQAAREVDSRCAMLARFDAALPADDVLESLDVILAAKQRVDEFLDSCLGDRLRFAEAQPSTKRRQAIRNYLEYSAVLVDLSGRLRYLLFDAVGSAARRLAAQPSSREELVDLLRERESHVGAAVMSAALFDPPADDANRIVAANDTTKAKILGLIRETHQTDLVQDVADFVREPGVRAELVIQAAETLRAIGLPQDARPGQDPELPEPAITAAQLHDILERLNPSALSGDWVQRRFALLSWLDERRRVGLIEPRYRFGAADLEPGDWLLMRNPSPYNLFTDLSPGLFTHVGVLALERGTDGKRRMVVVDLPERGTEMPATNADLFVQRTLHYVILRHVDREVRRKMGNAAVTLVGNETAFDLNFRLDGVERLRGVPLADQKIKTYCAGLLVLCAQETGRARDEFFPIQEHPAGGRMVENLASLGITVTDNVVSPTGALFSPRMQIVARRRPMYDPRRWIEESIYDHFAAQLESGILTPSSSWYQTLRLRLAEASEVAPLLGRLLARAADVSPEMDLVAAAKAGTVIENLDDIAYGASGEFLDARVAIRAGSMQDLAAEGYDEEDLAEFRRLRNEHASLRRRWQQRQVSPRELRIALVEYYVKQGRRQIDEEFFGVER